jgi:hypothetical protein
MIIIFIIQIVKATTKKVCKCHGSSSSCTMKTCMKKLETFDKVGQVLYEKYTTAIRVIYHNGSLRDEANNTVTKKKTKLVYYTPSPDYCHANKILKIPGVEGRVCEAATNSGLKKCRKLCEDCGLKMKLQVITRKVKCNCKFVWCCFVKCDECKKQVVTATCVRWEYGDTHFCLNKTWIQPCIKYISYIKLLTLKYSILRAEITPNNSLTKYVFTIWGPNQSCMCRWNDKIIFRRTWFGNIT